jgi:hypothetical protein
MIELPKVRSLSLVLAAAVACASNAVKAEDEDSDVPIRVWSSPDGTAKVVWERIGPVDGPTEQYALTLKRSKQSAVRLEAFDRDVSLDWSADSKTIVFTNYIGSNVADCYVVDIDKVGDRVDIADLVPNLPELKEAHVYVTCAGWLNPDEIRVKVLGHTDSTPSHNFDYRYVYNMVSKRLLPAAK